MILIVSLVALVGSIAYVEPSLETMKELAAGIDNTYSHPNDEKINIIME